MAGENYTGQNSGDDAVLVIDNRGTVHASNSLLIGNSVGSRGNAIVTGDGSTLEVVGSFAGLTVGFGGEGALSVVDGWRLTTTFLNVGGGNYGQLGTGLLSISGLGSSAEVYGRLTIAGYGDGSTGAVTVSEGGILNVQSSIDLGLGDASGSACLNIGAASADVADAVAPGMLLAPQVNFYGDNASLNSNHPSTAYTFDTSLASNDFGAGFSNHYAGNTTLTGESSAFSGDTIAHGGRLTVNDLLGGTATVESGGTLILTGNNTYSGGTSLLGGMVSVSADTSLGAGHLARSGRGRLRHRQCNSFTLAQDIAGSGDLVKQGDGTLILTGANNSYGNTLVQAGTLIGNADAISGNIRNAATVVFDQATNASFAGDILGLNGTDGAMTKRGAGMRTLGGSSTLDWTIEAGGLATAADRFGGDVRPFDRSLAGLRPVC